MTRPAAESESETETGDWDAVRLEVGGCGENWQPIGKSEKFTLPPLWGDDRKGVESFQDSMERGLEWKIRV